MQGGGQHTKAASNRNKGKNGKPGSPRNPIPIEIKNGSGGEKGGKAYCGPILLNELMGFREKVERAEA
jgi:hypothetical protein